MAEVLTEQQREAVDNRGGALLVSAAAGSGKTKVLVDRLMKYIMDPISPANINDFLIITFTEAAASELREKIAAKITDKIAEDPSNKHLQQQLRRIYSAQISTVHAFCSRILKEYAYKLDIPGDFRIALESECTDLKIKAVDMVLTSSYENAQNDADFCAFIDSQGLGRNDLQIPQIILKVYENAMCHPSPEKWLDGCCEIANISSFNDASETVWGKYLMEDLRCYLDEQIKSLERITDYIAADPEFTKPYLLLMDTISQIRVLRDSKTWDSIIENKEIDFGKLTFGKRADPQISGYIKVVRNACKTGILKKLRRFSETSDRALADLKELEPALRGVVAFTKQFISTYQKLKRIRKALDFSDLEQNALDLLVGKDRAKPTMIADEIGKRYVEVMVDEYQDTNEVQDAIFASLTYKRNNCFFVGDVKQSIYQFRLANPGIFLHKYNNFMPAAVAEAGQGRKVLLSKNFRSCSAVIDAVNDVFSAFMCKRIGGLDYGEDESLYLGLENQPDIGEEEVEFYGIESDSDVYTDEATFVASRIRQLLDGKHYVRDKESLRPITPDDIVILLRSPSTNGGFFRYALESAGIRCIMESSSDLLQTEEITVLKSFLQVINNPLMDIPLVSVLTSKVFMFTADDLARVRSADRHGSLYSALKACKLDKAENFLRVLDRLRKEAFLNDITYLINLIFTETSFDSIYASMDDGDIKSENIHAFYQIASDYESSGQYDLTGFLQHLTMLEQSGITSHSAAKTGGAVSIMSIHKSKGLEFPVVFISALSRGFNNMSISAQVLCNKDLGLGLGCADSRNRIRYPSIAKKAIAAKIIADELSEEMRILYVAMTRARDRLIMTYATKSMQDDLTEIAAKKRFMTRDLFVADVSCIGEWLLAAALSRTEAGAFLELVDYGVDSEVKKNIWKIHVVAPPAEAGTFIGETDEREALPSTVLTELQQSLHYVYPFAHATTLPSKVTATQLKGRKKDQEIAQYTTVETVALKESRKPQFAAKTLDGTAYGNAYHKAMQYISYDKTDSAAAIREELNRIRSNGYLTDEQADIVDCQKLLNFFNSEVGMKLKSAGKVVREFKFSVLQDAERFVEGGAGEKMLLQGVVDCAIIDDDGIVIIDFKTDSFSNTTLEEKVAQYTSQVSLYADALSKIYQLPVKEKMLYFFTIGKFVRV